MISVRSIIHRYAATLEKSWEHDRSQTVGASEIGQCARKTFFSKNDAQRDPDYADGWGARERGNLIENYFWLPAIRAGLPEGARLLYAGEDQLTLKNGDLSATTDGLVVGLPRNALAWAGVEDIGPGKSVVVECKSVDPRATITQTQARSTHKFQVQVQLGLMREFAKFNEPEYAIISYIDASFLDNVTEYVVKFDPRIYQAAKTRAEEIMTARNGIDLPPEGKITGDNECAYCAWASRCAHITVAGAPTKREPLDEEAATELKRLRDVERELAAAKNEAAADHARTVEDIKQFLREHNTRGHKDIDWSVSYSVVSGKATLDIDAVKAAGIDLDAYYKTGKPSERLTVK